MGIIEHDKFLSHFETPKMVSLNDLRVSGESSKMVPVMMRNKRINSKTEVILWEDNYTKIYLWVLLQIDLQ